jgi:hypothetical protein
MGAGWAKGQSSLDGKWWRNIKLEKQSIIKDWQLGVTFEKTAQNNLVEIGLTGVANKARVMMAHANIPHKILYKIFCKAYKTAATLDGYVVIKQKGIDDTRYVHWCGANPNYTNHLCMWGEAGTVRTKTKTTLKLDDHGVQCMFVGCTWAYR